MTAFALIPSGPGETGRPAPDRLVAGDPVFTTWEAETGPRIFAGIWQSTPGTWRVVYEEWEYFRILSGHSVLRGQDGTLLDLRAGVSAIIRPGFAGTWEVLETTTKDYVIHL